MVALGERVGMATSLELASAECVTIGRWEVPTVPVDCEEGVGSEVEDAEAEEDVERVLPAAKEGVVEAVVETEGVEEGVGNWEAVPPPLPPVAVGEVVTLGLGVREGVGLDEGEAPPPF